MQLFDRRSNISYAAGRFDDFVRHDPALRQNRPFGSLCAFDCPFRAFAAAPLLELPQALNVMEPFEELRNHRLRLRGEHKEESERLLAQMHVHQQRGDAIGSNRLLLAFVDLLYFIFGLCEQPLRERQEFSTDKEQTVQRIISLLEHSYTDDLHMEQLEERLHLSKSYIARLFKDVTGVTVFHYVYRRRINEAKIIFLMEPSVTVTEACYRLGYKHLAHFSRMFKQFVGVSPEQFKRRETQG